MEPVTDVYYELQTNELSETDERLHRFVPVEGTSEDVRGRDGEELFSFSRRHGIAEEFCIAHAETGIVIAVSGKDLRQAWLQAFWKMDEWSHKKYGVRGKFNELREELGLVSPRYSNEAKVLVVEEDWC